MVKHIENNQHPVNIIVGKEKQKGFYIAQFDSRQVNPRVTIGSTWLAHDKRYDRKFLVRVIDINYNDDYDLKQILAMVRENPQQPFDARSLEYYCAEVATLRLEGELTSQSLEEVFDQPTVLQTFLTPTRKEDEILIANPDTKYGFAIGTLRNSSDVSDSLITLEDRFTGFRTLISGASGFGKSTLVRNIARYWLENTKYGKIIDDLKGEYVSDIKNERNETVPGLYRHLKAKENLYLLTVRPRRFESDGFAEKIAGVIPLSINIDDIPPDSLEEIATHITPPQKAFLERYQDKKNLFSLLLRKTEDGGPVIDDWHAHFKGWIIETKSGRSHSQDDDYVTDLGDFEKSSYTPIFSVRNHLQRLASRPFIKNDGQSCLPRLRELLKKGATIILDKGGLTESDRLIISTVIANELYKHNEKFSSGEMAEQEKVIPFIYLVEEAHQLLSSERAKEGSTFVNFAKTGRSFQIGLAAVTQRPSSVDTNILSQFDNYITFRLTNEQDVKDLVKAKSDFQGFEGDIRTMKRGAAITAFGEPTKVQSIQVFEWTEERVKTLLSVEQAQLMQKMHSSTQTPS
jgi:DNA helicase HerA-like ATPase